MGPPLKIAFANARIADIVAKLEAIGCEVEGSSYREDGMPAMSLWLTLNGIKPFSICFIVEVTGQNETWLVYMPANSSMTLWDWLRLPLAPVLAVIEMFRPQKDYVPTEEERQLACARTQIEESLKADPAFVAVGVY